eukprot:m.168700 g.168700  ORF g.168700 m.168700 type:complete len:452 (+) comp18218_c0_seq1:120-1475(+)
MTKAMGIMKLLSRTVLLALLMLFQDRNVSCVSVRSNVADPVLHTSTGDVVGRTRVNKVSGEHYVDEFLGVPYAEPPVGNLRFRSPVLHSKWDSPRTATRFGPECAQVKMNDAFGGSEDCLYLNIWRPTAASRQHNVTYTKDASLPILVWIHGGGFIYGNGGPEYNGQTLAALHDIIVINIQYRLDVFGFLALETLAREHDHDSTGNYGLQDQRLALQWINDNAQSMGGDARRITIMGQSAGGSSVSAHLTSPASEGLFTAAIALSPLSESALMFPSRRQAVNFGIGYARYVGCDGNDDDELVTCLRKLTTKELVTPLRLPPADIHPPDRNIPLPRLLPFLMWGPVVDGSREGVEARPIEQLKEKRFNDVPLLLGTVRDEGTIFIPELPFIAGILLPLSDIGFKRAVSHFYNSTYSGSIEQWYEKFLSMTPADKANNLVTDAWFSCAVTCFC